MEVGEWITAFILRPNPQTLPLEDSRRKSLFESIVNETKEKSSIASDVSVLFREWNCISLDLISVSTRQHKRNRSVSIYHSSHYIDSVFLLLTLLDDRCIVLLHESEGKRSKINLTTPPTFPFLCLDEQSVETCSTREELDVRIRIVDPSESDSALFQAPPPLTPPTCTLEHLCFLIASIISSRLSGIIPWTAASRAY